MINWLVSSREIDSTIPSERISRHSGRRNSDASEKSYGRDTKREVFTGRPLGLVKINPTGMQGSFEPTARILLGERATVEILRNRR